MHYKCPSDLLQHGGNNTKIAGLIPEWAIHLRVGVNSPCKSLPNQNILGFCDLKVQEMYRYLS